MSNTSGGGLASSPLRGSSGRPRYREAHSMSLECRIFRVVVWPLRPGGAHRGGRAIVRLILCRLNVEFFGWRFGLFAPVGLIGVAALPNASSGRWGWDFGDADQGIAGDEGDE